MRKETIKRKALKTAGALILVSGLLLGTINFALAASDQTALPSTKHGRYTGEVVEILTDEAGTTTGITIKDREGNEVAFTITLDTKFYYARGKTAVKVGSLVTVVSKREPGNLPTIAMAVIVHPTRPAILSGKVLEKGNDFFTIDSKGQVFEVKVDDSTQYFQVLSPRPSLLPWLPPGQLHPLWKELEPQPRRELAAKLGPNLRSFAWNQWCHEASFEDIWVGDRVMVEVAETDDDLIAQRVAIMHQLQRLSGTISTISDASITITTEQGDELTIYYNSNTIFCLSGYIRMEPGQSATTFCSRDPDTGSLTARLVEVGITTP